MKISYLIASFIILALVAYIGSIFTSSGTNSEWYQSVKPAITPPNWIFPIAWGIIFFLIALSLYFVLISRKKLALIIYGINFFLNILWSIFYFQLKNPFLAFIEILILFISIIIMIIAGSRINKKAGYLLIPYLLWVIFAAILNYLSIK